MAGPGEGAEGGAGGRDPGDLALRLQVMTTLHQTLSAARAATVAESNGRAALYLSSCSATLVGLGLVGQATRLGPAFLLLAFALLALLLLVGLVTFHRVVQAGVEDAVLAAGEARARAFYLEALPALAPWMPEGGRAALPADLALPAGRSRLQPLLTAGGMVAVVNAALAGVAAGLALAGPAGAGLGPAAAGGLLAFALAYALHVLRIRAAWARAGTPGIRGGGG